MDNRKGNQHQRLKSPKSQKGSNVSVTSNTSGNNNVQPSNQNQNSRSQSRQKRDLSPQQRSKLAREKFQNLLLNANKVQTMGVGLKNSSAAAQATAAQMHANATAMNVTTIANSQAQSQQSIRSNGNVNSNSVQNQEKKMVPRNPNAFPNIDPRTFPKPMSHGISAKDNSISRPSITKSMVGIHERSRNLRAFVEKAMMEHKVFSCVGVYPAVKNALKKRGWVEKTGPINVVRSASIGPFRSELYAGTDDESDQAWITRNLRDYPPDFIWVIRRDNIDWKGMHKDQMINRYPKAWFTTKVGLSACLQQMHWYSEAGFSETFFPRCYRLCLEDERQAFQEDYRLTACMSYLRFFVETFDTKGPSALVDSVSRITPLSIDFASRQLGNYIRMRRHEDIDWLLPPNFMPQHWEAFLHQYVMVVHEKKKIRFETTDGVMLKYEMAKKTMHRIAQYWPQGHLDGVFNMWICKPGARSRGKGIVIMNSLEKIMDLLNHGNAREANWVVQKYMERPLLVYKTKFDIRQWFVITDWSPLTVWFYKESYIRFCTKPFVLEDFHESIHLCNNAIQCRYQNAESRDSSLPDENMWDCYTFQAYLKSIGKMEQWPKIYSGMKQAIIGVLLASQESVEARKGCFELYGADFMLSEDYGVWLIEINSCPCMAATTSITAKMCAQCLEDTIKIVIDRKANRNADPGMFEMVYRQPLSAVTIQQFTGHDLVVQGKKLTRDIDWPSIMSSKHSHRRVGSLATSINKNPRYLGIIPPPIDNLTFSDLLAKLRMKNAEMFQGFVNNSQAQTLSALTATDTVDRSLTGTPLNKMRQLSKAQKDNENANEIIPGMKKVYPTSKPGSSRGKSAKAEDEDTLSHLSKYFDNNTSTFANLVRIGKEIAEESGPSYSSTPYSSERQTGPGNGFWKRPDSFPGNPYLPKPEITRTLEEVRAAVNAASEKYGKTITSAVVLDKDIVSVDPNNNFNDSSSTVPDLVEQLDSKNCKPDIIVEPNLPNLPTLDLDLTSGGLIRQTDSIIIEEYQKLKAYSRLQSQHDPIPIQSPLIPDVQESPEIPSPVLDCKIDNTSSEGSEPKSNIKKSETYVSLIDFEGTIPPPPTSQALIIHVRDLPTNNFNTAFPFPNPEGNLKLQDILNNNLEFPSTSNSESDCDPDFKDFNFDPSLCIPSPRSSTGSDGPSGVGVVSHRQKNSHTHTSLAFHRHSVIIPKPRSRVRSSHKVPCHRIALKPSSASRCGGSGNGSTRTSLPTFPLKKIDLKLS